MQVWQGRGGRAGEDPDCVCVVGVTRGGDGLRSGDLGVVGGDEGGEQGCGVASAGIYIIKEFVNGRFSFWRRGSIPNSIGCVINALLPAVRVTLSTTQAEYVALLISAVIRGPVYCVWSMVPKPRVPAVPGLRLRVKTGCWSWDWAAIMKVGWGVGRTTSGFGKLLVEGSSRREGM